MELGTPGGMRAELNALVLSGEKTATTGLLADYAEEGEELEHLGERLALWWTTAGGSSPSSRSPGWRSHRSAR
ncbi:hypothetical protein [Kitasatospora sp. NPDC088346]|uniref:hypothetical protein n=1 Tax=Kitasatospora sp. NPDC088346 TaxID=3364073 RepID=UPI00382BA892